MSTKRRRGNGLVGLAEAADYLGVSPKTIRRRIADGSLTAYRMGPRLIRLKIADLDRLMAPLPMIRDPRAPMSVDAYAAMDLNEVVSR